MTAENKTPDAPGDLGENAIKTGAMAGGITAASILGTGLIGVRPEACVVYEDGEMGIVAAKAAGMEVIDVRPWYLPRG